MHSAATLIVLALLLVAIYKLGVARNSGNTVLGGVCSGIATHVGLSPALVRVLFVIAAILTNGFATLLYIGLWIVLPRR